MFSVIVAAHNEEAVIGRTLDALRAQQGEYEIIVSANGCTDETVAVAGSRGVRVVDRRAPGKAAALNAADRIARGFPRAYVDADIVLPAGAFTTIAAVFAARPEVLAVVPRRVLNTVGRPWPVRSYAAINSRLPVFRAGLFGRGVIVLSEEGRKRFAEFPPLISDDLFLDAQFVESEKAEAQGVEVVVETPLTTRALITRLVRVRRGNAQLRAASADGQIEGAVRESNRSAWLWVVVRDPRLIPAAVPYVAITLMAAVRARRDRQSSAWERDDSTRNRAETTETVK